STETGWMVNVSETLPEPAQIVNSISTNSVGFNKYGNAAGNPFIEFRVAVNEPVAHVILIAVNVNLLLNTFVIRHVIVQQQPG
ncbi:MAG: hypothetical protein ACK5XN_38060, partial [Bacteroidota bacterium]